MARAPVVIDGRPWQDLGRRAGPTWGRIPHDLAGHPLVVVCAAGRPAPQGPAGQGVTVAWYHAPEELRGSPLGQRLHLADWILAMRPAAVLLPPGRGAEEPLFVAAGTRVLRLGKDAARPPGAAPLRPKVAWVSCGPTAASGIAAQNRLLVPALARHADVHWVVGDGQGSAAGPGWRTVDAATFLRMDAESPFDHVVHAIGDSRHHLFQLPLLRLAPGILYCHDASFGGLVLEAAHAGLWERSFAEELRAAGGARRLDLRSPAGVEKAVLAAPMLRRFLPLATTVVATNAFAAGRFTASGGGDVGVVGLVTDAKEGWTREAARRHLGLPGGRFVVASLGIPATVKRLDTLLRAAAALQHRTGPEVSVHVVGPENHETAALRTLAARMGVRATFTGEVDQSTFEAHAAAADVCVQLRNPSRGEMSAAVLQAMAYGLPTVVSDGGALGQLPDGACLKVPTDARETEILAHHLQTLRSDPGLRTRLGAAALALAARHEPARVAVQWMRRLEASPSSAWLRLATRACLEAGVAPDSGFIEAWARLRAAGSRTPREGRGQRSPKGSARNPH